MLETVYTPTSESVPIPIREFFPWLVFAVVLLLAIYFVGVEEGATAIFPVSPLPLVLTICRMLSASGNN